MLYEKRKSCRFGLTMEGNVQIMYMYTSTRKLQKAQIISVLFSHLLKPVPLFTSLCSEHNVFFMTLTLFHSVFIGSLRVMVLS